MRTEYGWIYDSEASSQYIMLRYELVMISDAMDSDSDFNMLAPQVALGLPNDLYSESRWSEECLEMTPEMPPADWYGSALQTIDKLETEAEIAFIEIGRKIVSLNESTLPLIAQTKDTIARLQKKRSEAEAIWSSELTAVSNALDVETLAANLDYSFIINDNVRKGVNGYSTEAIAAFKTSLYRSSFTCARAAMEGLLVYSLQLDKANAELEYFDLFLSNRPNQKPGDIEKWNFYQLVTVAKRLKIISTENLAGYCLRANALRNSLHISLIASKIDATASDALFSLSILGDLYQEVRKYSERHSAEL